MLQYRGDIMATTMTERTQESIATLAVHVGYMRDAIEAMQKQIAALPTTEDFKALKIEVDKITPWTNTLRVLERAAIWVAAMVAGSAALVAAFAFWKH